MKHLGDITKIDWFAVEPVDVVTGGSPCQDLSIAGKRKGLAGERSGLFMEQIRCVKELRQADVHRGRTGIAIRPRFMVWENVPGASSSNGGQDFRAVLEETIRIVCPECPDVPMPEKGGWPKSGCLYDEMGRWSIAWRLHDAQFWGVPQRRKRISLVADFGGLSAPEILFERKGLSGNFEQGRTAREESARGTGTSTDSTSVCYGLDHVMLSGGTTYQGKGYYEDLSGCLKTLPHGVVCLNDQGGGVMDISVDVTSTLRAQSHGHEPILLESNQNKATIRTDGICTTLPASMGMGGGYVPMITEAISFQERGGKPGGGKGILIQEEKTGAISAASVQMVAGFKHKAGAKAGNIGFELEKSPTLNAETTAAVFDARGNGDGMTVPTITGDHESRVTDYTALIMPFDTTQITSPTNGSKPAYGDPCHPLAAQGHPPAIVMGTGQANAEICENLSPTPNCNHEQPIVAYALKAKANLDHRADSETYPITNGTVRRLTPLECERLQGYPDGWTDIGDWTDSKGKRRKAADAPRYKALGNSIALPFWKWLLKRISAQYERDATLGSLFDGLGGFPYCWERVNGKGSARWASEIEEFPIAVTKIRFGED